MGCFEVFSAIFATDYLLGEIPVLVGAVEVVVALHSAVVGLSIASCHLFLSTSLG